MTVYKSLQSATILLSTITLPCGTGILPFMNDWLLWKPETHLDKGHCIGGNLNLCRSICANIYLGTFHASPLPKLIADHPPRYRHTSPRPLYAAECRLEWTLAMDYSWTTRNDPLIQQEELLSARAATEVHRVSMSYYRALC